MFRCRPALLFLVFCLLTALRPAAPAQTPVHAVLLSDIHFDPFHNPRLLPQLRAAPPERWPAILNSGNGLKADADLAKLELACRSPGLDTDWFLLKQTLAAAGDAERKPVFLTLTGDLLAHQFPCRFNNLVPGATPAQLAAFSAKTVAFVILQLRLAFPHVPVYVALGNNDSGCADYRETPGSPFMQSSTRAMVRAAVQGSAHAGPSLNLSPEGDYSLTLPAPFAGGRMIVLQDIYDADWYSPCNAPAYTRAEQHVQIAWLRAELSRARAAHQPVWVIGHIPPGVDAFGSFAKYVLRPKDLCTVPAHAFLADTQLPDTLLDFADVVRLALFAHTHMDEVRLLRRPAANDATGKAVRAAAVPEKLVPSVTAYYGNHPAFLVATIDPKTLTLLDWRTVVSSDTDGSNPPWAETYSFRSAYNLPDFSAASAATLIDGFAADGSGDAPRSKFFRDHFYAGDVGLYSVGLHQIWPAYACAARENREDRFHACLCPANPPSPGGQ